MTEEKKDFWFGNEIPEGVSSFSHINTETGYMNTVGVVSSDLMELLEETGFVVDGEIQPLFQDKEEK